MGLESNWGRDGALEWASEWAVEGRELSVSSRGRGGSGGGDSSWDASELAEALREKLWMMFSVGLAKSRASTWSGVFVAVAAAASLLCWVGVVGALPCSEVGDCGSAALPVWSIKRGSVGCHRERKTAALPWSAHGQDSRRREQGRDAMQGGLALANDVGPGHLSSGLSSTLQAPHPYRTVYGSAVINLRMLLLLLLLLSILSDQICNQRISVP